MPTTILDRPLDDIEITLTFHYHLGSVLRSHVLDNSNGVVTFNEKILCGRDWRKSETAHYFSNDFVEELVVTHFHLKPSIGTITAKTTGKDYEKLGTTYEFDIPERISPKPKSDHFKSIAGVEVTIWEHGYLTVVLRLKNKTAIKAEHLVNLIRHPELVDYDNPKNNKELSGMGGSFDIRGCTTGVQSGDLVIQSDIFMEELEPEIGKILNLFELEHLRLEEGDWTPLEKFQEKKDGDGLPLRSRCTRPYVGVIINGTSLMKFSRSEANFKLLKKLVVACARTTPSFLENFENIDKYLDHTKNIYGPGGSMVLVESRGWCVFNGGERDPYTFRLGVIETTHFVINVIDTAARARKRYSRDIHREGAPLFQTLNITINKVAPIVLTEHEPIEEKKWNGFRKDIATATSFLARARLISPCEDMTSLLESHLRSSTARSAVERCKELSSWEQLGLISREKISNYTAFLKTSSDHLSTLSIELARESLKMAKIALFAAILIGLYGVFIR